MTTGTKRDLHADLAICAAATEGPWNIGGGKFGETNVYAGDFRIVRDIDYDKQADATFIAEARTGWPHAIERAIAAEAENELLRADRDQWRVDAEVLSDESAQYLRALREIDTHIRATSDPIPHIVATLKRELPEYDEEVLRDESGE